MLGSQEPNQQLAVLVQVIGLFVGFSAGFFAFTSLVPLMLVHGGSAALNLSLLASDFWAAAARTLFFGGLSPWLEARGDPWQADSMMHARDISDLSTSTRGCYLLETGVACLVLGCCLSQSSGRQPRTRKHIALWWTLM